MCSYLSQNTKYRECTAESRHLISTNRYDWCEKAKKEGYVCTDATPAEDLSGKVIVFGTTTRLSEMPLLRHTG
jgi:hypothetical protein